MSYDLSAACKSARMHIDVPAVPLDTIKRAGSEAAPARGKRRLAMILAIALPLVAAGASAAVWQGAQIVTTARGGIVLKSDKMDVVLDPSPDRVQRAVERANFTVTVPSGLPNGTKLTKIATATGLVAFTYDLPGQWRASHHLLNILVLNAKTTRVNNGGAGSAMVLQLRASHVRVYQTGDEAVFIEWDALTPAELARLEASMRLH
jgi:hypothetical protein